MGEGNHGERWSESGKAGEMGRRRESIYIYIYLYLYLYIDIDIARERERRENGRQRESGRGDPWE